MPYIPEQYQCRGCSLIYRGKRMRLNPRVVSLSNIVGWALVAGGIFLFLSGLISLTFTVEGGVFMMVFAVVGGLFSLYFLRESCCPGCGDTRAPGPPPSPSRW